MKGPLRQSRRPLIMRLASWFIGLLAITSSSYAMAGCAANSVSIPFGTVDVLPASAIDTRATLSVTCSSVSGQQRLCISIGKGSAGDAVSRQLAGSGGTLRFDLYEDTARTQLWGSWYSGWDTAGLQLDVPGNGTYSISIYARLFGSQQQIIPGSYSSTITDVITQWGPANGLPCPTGTAASSNMVVTANVSSSCVISASTLDFGSVPSLNNAVAGTTVLGVQCSNTVPYMVSLDGGTMGATNPSARKMIQGSGRITYGLYQDTAHVQPWGDQAGVNTKSATGAGTSQAMSVYGLVPAQPTPSPGAYTDTIIATVTY
jgi:spore coat protein U-like protein